MSPGLDAESKSTAEGFLNETSGVLALNEYKQAMDSYGKAQKSGKKDAILASVEKFKAIINEYPTTKYGDLSHGKIGDAYTMLADKEVNYYYDALEYFNYLPKKYATLVPSDNQVEGAINYCLRQIQVIQDYMKSKNIPLRQTQEGGNE